MSDKWGWYSTLYHLAGERVDRMEDVTRLGIMECLTFMCYRQDLVETNNVNVNI